MNTSNQRASVTLEFSMLLLIGIGALSAATMTSLWFVPLA